MPFWTNMEVDMRTKIGIGNMIFLIGCFACEKGEIRQKDIPYNHILFALWKKEIVEGYFIIGEKEPGIGLMHQGDICASAMIFKNYFTVCTRKGETFIATIPEAEEMEKAVIREFYKNSSDEKKRKLNEIKEVVQEMIACCKNGELDKWWAGELNLLKEED